MIWKKYNNLFGLGQYAWIKHENENGYNIFVELTDRSGSESGGRSWVPSELSQCRKINPSVSNGERERVREGERERGKRESREREREEKGQQKKPNKYSLLYINEYEIIVKKKIQYFVGGTPLCIYKLGTPLHG